MKSKIFKYSILIGGLSFLGMSNIMAASECAICGPDALPIPVAIPNFVSKLVLLAQIATPILIIVLAFVKYLKAITSSDDKASKEANSSFIRSFITGIGIFLIVTIVRFVFGLIETDDPSALNCVSCFLNGEEECQVQVCPERDMENGGIKDDNPESNTHESENGTTHGGVGKEF